MGPTAGVRGSKPCLLCRAPVKILLNPGERTLSFSSDQNGGGTIREGCAISLCTIFGLPESHPFKDIYKRAFYCGECLKEVEQADVTLGKLEILRQNLLRFQNRVYSKLGDNYFQIGNRERLTTSWEQFEAGGKAMQGKRFGYDDVVKVLYEKLDFVCCRWERFTSEGRTAFDADKKDAETQTGTFGSVTTAKRVKAPSANNTGEIITPDLNPPSVDPGDDGGGGGDSDYGGGDDIGAADYGGISDENEEEPRVPAASSVPTKTLQPDPLGSKSVAPEAKLVLPFLQPRVDFSEKIFCTVDPENCKRFFYDSYNLQVHIQAIHEGNENPHQCPECSRAFKDEARLKSHYIRTHPENIPSFQPIMCEQCGNGFPTQGLLNRHIKVVHTVQKQIIPCSYCTAPFKTEQELQAHEDLHRAKEDTLPFACVYCELNLPNSIQLKKHFKEVHAENKFPCDQCGKILNSESSLRSHLTRHKGLYTCEQCGYQGASQNQLERHMSVHTKEKTHTCEQCGRTFKQERNLRTHRRMHTGERPFKCAVCQKTFREAADLRRHEEGHSVTANYFCGECGKGFRMRDSLKKHKRMHRPDYVPQKPKGPRKPRTEEQKEKRRIRDKLKREKEGKPVRTYEPRMPRPPVKKRGLVEVKVKTKKKKRSKTVKAVSKRVVKEREWSSGESGEEEMEHEQELGEESVEYKQEVDSQQQQEIEQAVRAIEGVEQQQVSTVMTQDLFGGVAYQQQGQVFHVEVVGEVKAASQLVQRRPGQYQFL